MSRTSFLYQLQLLDSQIDTSRQRLAEIIKMIGETAALKSARARHQRSEAQLKAARSEMRDIELEVKSLEQKITQHEQRLYSGKVLNPREAASMQEEVASLKRWHTKREEDLLEAMLAVEDGESDLAEAEEQLAAVEADWQGQQAEFIGERASLQEQLARLAEDRSAAYDRVAADDRAIYENLRRKKAGRAVVAVKNEICDGCGVRPSSSQIQHARSGDALVFCDSCGRILHVQ